MGGSQNEICVRGIHEVGTFIFVLKKGGEIDDEGEGVFQCVVWGERASVNISPI